MELKRRFKMKRQIKHKCKQCKYSWLGYKKKPIACPNCKSREWR
jgi:rubrerythrin